MQLQVQDRPAFKQWLLPRLATISDAEPAVLAEYVVELFSAAGSAADIKRSSVEQLSDFLEHHTQAFVDQVAEAIEQRSWANNEATEAKEQGGGNGGAKEPTRPAQPAPTPPAASAPATAAPKPHRPLSSLAPDAPAFVPRDQAAPLSNNAAIPKGPRAQRINGPQQLRGSSNNKNGRLHQPRKRKLHERETSQPRSTDTEPGADVSAGERPRKQLARRGGGNFGGFGTRPNPVASTPRPGAPSTATPFTPNLFPSPQPAPLLPFPPADAMNPFNFFSAMSAMMSMMPPSSLPAQAFGAQAPGRAHPGQAATKVRCPDYETKGICILGTLCPFDHGQATVAPTVPEYDPNYASLGMQPHANGRLANHQGTTGNARGSHRRERTGSEFSHAGPSYNSLDDTVVVEQIPEAHFTEQHVRDFFSQFGAIVEVQMHAYKRLAVVKFNDHPAAQRAYDSPKVIFDNRFVKVHWYKPEQLPQSNGTKDRNGITAQTPSEDGVSEKYDEDEDMIDMEEFNKQQARLQEEFQEKRKRAEEAAARSNMLNTQLKAKEEELSRLRSKVIEKAKAKGVEAINRKEQQAASDGSSQSKGLASLQAEAEGLFAQAESDPAPKINLGGFTNGRGSWRGGGFRGRGNGRGNRSGVVRLDNRPRRLAAAGIKAGSERERALKQYLLNVEGCNLVLPHIERVDTLVIGFDQRYQAELFLSKASQIPNVGDLMLSWIANDASVVREPTESEPTALHRDTDDDASIVDGQVEPKVEVDLDVADDGDQWL